MLGNLAKVKQKEAVAALQAAMNGGVEADIQQAWDQFHESVVESVKQDFEMANGDEKILAQRGYRQLTAKEKEFYNKLIEAGKSDDPKQAMSDLITVKAMPETIFEDVYKDLTEEHPLLAKINFQNVKYLTKWILNDHTKKAAAWGKINSKITEEIESSFKVVDIVQSKLTAFTVIERDMLDLGPVFLDGYIRTFLKEAIYLALEEAILTGDGLDKPVGLNRDIHKGVSFSTSTGYPKKTAVKVKSFLPAEYGKVLAELAESETGRMRKFDEVTLVCNQVDYLTKVMPATTVMTSNGTYATNLFPFPTDVTRSNEMPTGEALVFLPEEYFLGVGAGKEGNIEFSDEFKFLDDQRTFKIKMYAAGKAFDNTVAVLLDISELDPAYITVLNKAAAGE